MPLDLEKIRQRVAQLNGQRSSGVNFWKPEVGEYKVRVLPWKNLPEGSLLKEVWFYYGIGNNRGIVAPTQLKKPDPIQDLITKLHSSGKKEDKELAKKLYPKMRVFAPIVIRGEESKGVMIWSFNKQIYQRLLGFALDAEVGDFTDPNDGFDLLVKLSKSGKMYNNRAVVDTVVDAARRPSKLLPDPEKVTALLATIPDLDAYYKLNSYEEIKHMLDQWLEGGAQDPNQGPGTEGAGAISSGDDELDKLAREISEPAKPVAEAADKAQKPRSNGKKVKSDDSDAPVDKSNVDLDDAFKDLLG